jgi:hypothetical protein
MHGSACCLLALLIRLMPAFVSGPMLAACQPCHHARATRM